MTVPAEDATEGVDVDQALDPRQSRQAARQRAISQAVMDEGAIRIDDLAERFGISKMTVHRDLDDLQEQGLLRKARGMATVLSTSLVESSDVYRAGLQSAEKEALARAVLQHIDPGEAIFLDDSTTVMHLAHLLGARTPLTVITNVLTLMNVLHSVRGISLISLGGSYYNWCSAFMGRMTIETIAGLRADTFIMSTSAVTDDICYHQSVDTVDTKRAMFEASARRILLVDHTKFGRRALHRLAALDEFDLVIVDSKTGAEHIERLRSSGIRVEVAGVPQADGVPDGSRHAAS
ncbi:DeoR/GlpR family DNA-binding transcription regulator [Microbacterium tumbae]